MQMGYQFSEGLEKSMINDTVIEITILSRNPQTFNKNVVFEWNVTEIKNKSFSLNLYFKNVTQVTPRDLLKVRFLNPAIFFINRTVPVVMNQSEDNMDGSEINEIDRQGVELKGKNVSAFIEQIRVEMNPNFKIEVFIPP